MRLAAIAFEICEIPRNSLKIQTYVAIPITRASIASRGKNVKIVFRAYFRQQWIDVRQTKLKMISGPFYTYFEYNHQRNCLISVIYVCLSVFLSVCHKPFIYSIGT